MDISIITALYNRLDLTRTYLESLERTLAGWNYEVLLVDDGSTDGTREFLGTLPGERYRVWLNDAPRGFAANNNSAARRAQAPLLCLLNNDTVLLPGWLEPMARLARWDRRVAMVGNVQREPVSGLIDHFGVFFDPDKSYPLHAGKNHPLAPDQAYLSWPAVTGACVVIRKEIFLELGGFDEGFRNGFEDVDLCLRAGSLGYRHFVANRSVIYHHVSASPGRRQHETANVRRYLDRWQGRVPLGQPPILLHREGSRYLRKHRWRPWRYNFRRFCRALEQRLAPWSAGSRLSPATAAAFRLRDLFRRRPASAAPSASLPAAPKVFLVMDDTVKNPGRSGIQTVVRSLAAAFGKMRAPVRMVVWNSHAGHLYPLPPTFSAGLEAESLREPSDAALPLHQQPGPPSEPAQTWVLMPELIYNEKNAARLVDYTHRQGWRLAVIFYDAIPIKEPAFVPPALPGLHSQYMTDFSRADLILPISGTSAQDWRDFVTSHGLPQPAVQVCSLGSDVSSAPRVQPEEIPALPAARSSRVHMLCISTLEPRKNHRTLLAAYELAAAARPELRLELSLVGASYAGSDEIAREVERFVERHPDRLTWHKQIEYSFLRRLYEEADFTVYPTVLEGFGLPIIESLWFGRPCVCANFGVMAETAAGGGCLTVDVRNARALAGAILALADSPEERRELALAATARRLKTWDEYAAEVLGCLK